MDVTIDDYGRIVIPKPIRDRLGLESGSSLSLEIAEVDEDRRSITLRLKGQESPLQRKGDLLVHTGQLTDEGVDIVEVLRDHRTERGHSKSGFSG